MKLSRRWVFLLGAAVLAVGSGTAWAEETKSSGSEPPAIKWEKLGASSGRALIFLPALGMPGSYWSKVYEPLAATHPIYVVTLAGSGGLAPISGPRLDKTVDAVANMIKAEKLDKPILVGHLLGAHLAMRVAAAYPDAVGGVFAFPLLVERSPPERRAEDAKRAAASYLEVEKDMWMPSISVQIKSSVEDSATASKLIDLMQQCDQKTYGELMGEIMADNYEASLSRIKVPIFLIAPISPASRNIDLDKQFERLSAAIQARLDLMRRLYPNITKCEVAPMRNTRLFPMLDAPDRVVFHIERYLARVDKPQTQWGTTVVDAPASAPAAGEKP